MTRLGQVPRWVLIQSFEVLFVALCMINGVRILLGGPAPKGIEALTPTPVVYGWGLLLVVCGGMVEAGLFWWGEPKKGMNLERGGLWPLMYASVVYGLTAIAFNGPTGYFAGSVVGVLGIAAGYRASQLHWWLSLPQPALIRWGITVWQKAAPRTVPPVVRPFRPRP